MALLLLNRRRRCPAAAPPATSAGACVEGLRPSRALLYRVPGTTRLRRTRQVLSRVAAPTGRRPASARRGPSDLCVLRVRCVLCLLDGVPAPPPRHRRDGPSRRQTATEARRLSGGHVDAIDAKLKFRKVRKKTPSPHRGRRRATAAAGWPRGLLLPPRSARTFFLMKRSSGS